jgi:hypothetical protein
MKKVISTAQSSSNIREVLHLLTSTSGRLASLSQPFPETQLREPLAIGKRSFVEETAHLLNCEARTSEAIYLALLLKEPFLNDVHPERLWGSLVHYESFIFADLLVYFTLRRKTLLAVLKPLSEEAWSRVVREEGKTRKESVYWKARALALHELHHLDLIETRLSEAAVK